MAQNVTLQDYLNNDPGVKEAKKILSEATKSLTGARNVAPDVLAELQAIKTRAQQVYDKLVSDTTTYFKKNYVGISTSGISDSIAKLEESKKSAPNQDALDSIQISIDTLKNNLANPKPYTEPVVVKKEAQDNWIGAALLANISRFPLLVWPDISINISILSNFIKLLNFL